jgi:oxygen-dependent protoporphyrinogen oxidase
MLENIPGLGLAGNGYEGIGIPDCIHSGELAVVKILQQEKYLTAQR